MKAIYAGSFNLFHAGHYYVYNKACQLFGRENVYLCVAINRKKKIDPQFIKWTLNPITPNVIIAEGLVANIDATILIRGLRDTMDLAEELTMADWNEELGRNTIFIPCTGELRHISSSALRELYYHGVKLDRNDNIPSQTYLSFKRWQVGELPTRKLFCGKISIGKSTYLKKYLKNNIQHVGDCDELIWKFFTEKEKEFIKKQLTKIINGRTAGYESVIAEMAKTIDWYRLLNEEYTHFKVSVLGRWMRFIPLDVLCKFQIVELVVNDDVRLERIKPRKLSEETVGNFDRFYQSPYFVDETINIGL